MLFTCELDIPPDYGPDDVIDLFAHIGAEITEGTESEEIVTFDGRTVGTWEIM